MRGCSGLTLLSALLAETVSHTSEQTGVLVEVRARDFVALDEVDRISFCCQVWHFSILELNCFFTFFVSCNRFFVSCNRFFVHEGKCKIMLAICDLISSCLMTDWVENQWSTGSLTG